LTFKDAAIVLIVAVVFLLAGHYIWPGRETTTEHATVLIDSSAVDSLNVVVAKLTAHATTVQAQAVVEQAKRKQAERKYAALLAQLQKPDSTLSEWPAVAYDTTVTRRDSITLASSDTTINLVLSREIRLTGEYWFPPYDEFHNLSATVKPHRTYLQLVNKLIEKETVQKIWALEPILGAAIIAILATLLIRR
jgi:hypothetical protein